ncbi:unnamed protein product [Closterium sp. NIES-64]|nr:unnamed protein product [Closterium sp. NIES-64]
MPASRLLAPRAPSALADLTAVMRIHDAPAAAAASYLSPGSVVPFPYGFGGGIGERGVSSSSRCGCHQQRSCRARRHARLLAARTRKVVIARAAIRSASPPPSSPSASAGRVHATIAAGAAATVEAQSAASAALPTVAIPTVLPRGIEKDKEVVLLAESAAKGEDGAASREVVASAVGERAESAVQRDGSVILRFAPLPDSLAPTAHALSPAPAAPRAERDSIGAPRGGGETPPGGGAAEVRADAGVVAFVTACTSEFSREVPDALIEEIVGLPLRLTPVDHMAKWVAISAHHTVAAINQVIDLPASALHHGSLPSLLRVLGLSKPLLPSAPSSSPSSAPPVVAPTAPFQGGRPTPPPPVPVSAAAALPAQHAPPSAAASIAVTTITGVVLAGLVQFLASFAGLVGRVPGGSSGVGQSRLLWNLPAATVLLLVAAVKVWAAWWHQHHRQQVGAAV